MSKTFRIVKSHFRSRISQIKRHRNTFSLIHRLPVEVLVEIFRYAAQDESYAGGRYLRLGDLSRVCTFWASIIERSPTLWTTIYINDDTRLIQKIISSSALKSTDGKSPNSDYQTKKKNTKRLLECLTDASAPRLEKLCLSVDLTSGGAGTRIDLFHGGAGCLKELHLSGLSIPWTSPLLSRLRVLRLAYLKESVAVTTMHILTTLTQCPEISELQIHNCDLRHSNAPDLPARLELPHLRVLSFCYVTPSAASYSILRRISSPKYDQFILKSHPIITGPTPPDNLLETISHLVPSVMHLATLARHVTMCLGYFHCQYATEDFNLQFCLAHPSPPTVLRWITTALGDAMKSVQVELDISSLPSESDLLAVSSIPIITSLVLECSLNDQTPVIRFLSTPTLVDGKKHWPFPNLASLEVEEEACDPSEIRRMVESRYGRTTESKKAKSKALLPAPFTSLVIDGSGTTLNDRTFRRIREIVGDDCFTWDIQEDDEDEDDESARDAFG
ncbi:hypothetical protein FRB99_007319 [Tulasnella sp. 403]|nr:hypothetical protein FRB99_007319 [Tulasnella sp. 403]